MTALAERDVSALVEQLSILRGYHHAVRDHYDYDDDTGPLSEQIGAVKLELAARLGCQP